MWRLLLLLFLIILNLSLGIRDCKPREQTIADKEFRIPQFLFIY